MVSVPYVYSRLPVRCAIGESQPLAYFELYPPVTTDGCGQSRHVMAQSNQKEGSVIATYGGSAQAIF
ncbi:MAG: hypothetical protein ACFBSG_01090 [Leptolyngbyaceae cyanobacterium]